ncbi:cobalt ECF transporter T component CbiQ [Consotaella aegiceratis]|uniref:cobalt ECF transporter T component CbiQ n=1 Tax=Consotaella aegiceratis TaxID=3097961 RepID=UPI002F427AFC
MNGFIAGFATAERGALDALDPRARLLAALAAVLTAVALHSSPVLVVMLVLTFAAAPLAGLSPRRLVGRMAHIEGFLVLLALLLPFTVDGTTLAQIGPLTISRSGLERAIVLLLRANLSILTLFILLSGLEPVRFAHALAKLGVPVKLVHLILFSARYVTVIGGETARLSDALRARAFRPGTSLHTLRTLAHFTGQILVRALERAERVDEAMRCRAFDGRFALVSDLQARPRDGLFLVGVALTLSLAIVVDRLA